MDRGQRSGDLHHWRQLSLVGPSLIRVSSVVWLDGLRGEGQWSTLVTDGVDRDWVSCIVVPSVPLSRLALDACTDMTSAIESNLKRLSPF